MTFKSITDQFLLIKTTIYHYTKHPATPGVAYDQEGWQATGVGITQKNLLTRLDFAVPFHLSSMVKIAME